MKKRLFVGCVFFLLLGAGFQFLVSKPMKDDLTADDLLLEIDEVYLNVFKKFRTLNLKNDRAHFWTPTSVLELKRDPFRIASEPQRRQENVARTVPIRKKERLNLGGILWDASSPMAIINGKIVKAGSRVGNYQVSRITRRKVILRSGKQTVLLQLPRMETSIH